MEKSHQVKKKLCSRPTRSFCCPPRSSRLYDNRLVWKEAGKEGSDPSEWINENWVLRSKME